MITFFKKGDKVVEKTVAAAKPKCCKCGSTKLIPIPANNTKKINRAAERRLAAQGINIKIDGDPKWQQKPIAEAPAPKAQTKRVIAGNGYSINVPVEAVTPKPATFANGREIPTQCMSAEESRQASANRLNKHATAGGDMTTSPYAFGFPTEGMKEGVWYHLANGDYYLARAKGETFMLDGAEPKLVTKKGDTTTMLGPLRQSATYADLSMKEFASIVQRGASKRALATAYRMLQANTLSSFLADGSKREIPVFDASRIVTIF